jgi:hypothetical protein
MSGIGSYLRVNLTLGEVEPVEGTNGRFTAHLVRSKRSDDRFDAYICRHDGMWAGGRENATESECQAYVDGWLDGYVSHKNRIFSED